MTIRIGTSGWSYDHWKGGFYPVDLAKSRNNDYAALAPHNASALSSICSQNEPDSHG